jgi:Ni,Fe-hydrogenase maturation factor
VGVAEAPPGTLIHHYRVDNDGLVQWVNLIIATGHNNMAMNKAVREVARHYVRGDRLAEPMLNRVEAVIRCYDPCLSCSTHAIGQMPLHVQLVGPRGAVLDELRRWTSRRSALAAGFSSSATATRCAATTASAGTRPPHSPTDPRLADADVLIRHQLTPELAQDITHARLVVLIDACGGAPPGTVSVRRVEPGYPLAPTWSHNLDPAALVGLAVTLYGASPPVFLVTITGAFFGYGDRLSPPVRQALPEIANTIDVLQAQQIPCSRMGEGGAAGFEACDGYPEW